MLNNLTIIRCGSQSDDAIQDSFDNSFNLMIGHNNLMIIRTISRLVRTI